MTEHTDTRTNYGETRETTTIILPSGRRAEVSAYGPRMAFGILQDAEVNWSALSSVPVADARAYAHAILRAADAAESMTYTGDGD